MDLNDQLLTLLATAEAQQQAIEEARRALSDEREALAKERAALAADQEALRQSLRVLLAGTVSSAVRESLSRVTETTTKALTDAGQPALNRWAEAGKEAEAAATKLRRAGAWFSWRWMALCVGVAALSLLLMWGVGWALVAWQKYQLDDLSDQTKAATEELATLKAQAEDWAQKAGRVKLGTCITEKRLCVKVDLKAGPFGPDRDYYILSGY